MNRKMFAKVVVVFVVVLVAFTIVSCSKKDEDPKNTNRNSSLPTFPTILDTSVEPTLEVSETETTTTEPATDDQMSSEVGTTTQTEITSVEETTIIETTTTQESTTTIPATTEEPTTEYNPLSAFTFTDMGKTMYTNQVVNVRTLPSLNGEIVATLKLNTEVWVTGQCNETQWYRIAWNDAGDKYVSIGYLSDSKTTQQTQPTNKAPSVNRNSSGFVYYTVSGQSPNYDYEKYLYDCLAEVNITWWYPYAVAQIWQESRWNPSSYNGVDAGICQFNEATFQARAKHHANVDNANVWDPYTSLYVYSRYIRDILVGCNYDVEAALSYYIKGHWNDRHQSYIDAVYKWYNALGK